MDDLEKVSIPILKFRKMKLLQFIRSGILGPAFHGPPAGLWVEVHDATGSKCQVLWVRVCILLGGGSTAFIRDRVVCGPKMKKSLSIAEDYL